MPSNIDTRSRTNASDVSQQGRLLRYNNGAVFLHWFTALILISQVAVGFLFVNMQRGPARGDVFTVHKTLGAVILLLALVRLAWRLGNPPPPYPLELPKWERLVGLWNHRIFYALLIALPVTGLMAISGAINDAGRASTPLLGGVPLPVIPGVSKSASEQAGNAHVFLVFLTLALLVLHIGAALKHQMQRNRAAGRMPPFTAAGEHAVPSP